MYLNKNSNKLFLRTNIILLKIAFKNNLNVYKKVVDLTINLVFIKGILGHFSQIKY